MNQPANDPKSLFLVDDDEAVLDSATLLFRLMGWNVTSFATADACLKALQAGPVPACVVTDMRMPRMTGWDLMTKLRDLGMAVPVVLITAYADPKLLANARAAGTQVVAKPLAADELLPAIDAAIAGTPTLH